MNKKRKLLKVLSFGGAVAATQLPAKWAKPIVEAVSLPAHAQTSLPSEDTNCALPLTIGDLTAECSDPSNGSTGDFSFYQIDVSGQCPVLVGPLSSSPSGGEIQVTDGYNAPTNTARIWIVGRDSSNGITGETGAAGGSFSCTSQILSDTNSSFTVPDSEDNPWTLSFELSTTDTVLTYFNIELMPDT